ncbi:MAG: hypothetical protein ACOZQL_28585 [Myxococcota bacterium]
MRWLFLVTTCLLVFACPGPTAIEAGAPCTAETVGRCDPTAPRLLQCSGGAWVVYADCKGPRGCTLSDETADCDTSGNSVGDRCAPTSEGKARCDPDGGLNILQCLDGGLDLVWTCTTPTICGVGDAGQLTCI